MYNFFGGKENHRNLQQQTPTRVTFAVRFEVLPDLVACCSALSACEKGRQGTWQGTNLGNLDYYKKMMFFFIHVM